MDIDYQSKISKVVNGIAPSAIRRFFDLANEMKGEVISLSIGEPDFVTPWNIREAGIFSLEDGKRDRNGFDRSPDHSAEKPGL